MKGQSFRSCWMLVLSLVLLYSRGASAIDSCLRDEHHVSYGASGSHYDLQTAANHNDSQGSSVPIIHCTWAMHDLPAAIGASTRFTRSREGTALQMSLLSQALSRVLKNDLWLDALFKRVVTFSLPADLARHLFLSVLQI